MPYIHEGRRAVARTEPDTVGELTYAIQQVIKGYLERKGSRSYQRYAEVLGALRGAELDVWDRHIWSYEKLKRDQNGDVW